MTATEQLLKDLENPDKYVKGQEAEVWMEHEKKDAAGNVTKKVTKADLELYAAETNKRDAAGCPSSMTIGHTVDDKFDESGKLVWKATEMDQPPVVGKWRHHRVAWSPQKKCFVVLATPYVMKEHYETARTYPNVSVEAWNTRKVLDPIAIMRRTPDQPMQWHLAGMVTRYSMTPGEQRYRFEMPGMDPTGQPSGNAPGSEEESRFRMMLEACCPGIFKMCEKYAAECGGEGGGTGNPTMGTPNPMGGDKKVEDKERHAMEEQIKAKDAEIAKLQRFNRDTTRKTEISKFAAVVEEGEEADMMEETPEKYAAHVRRLELRAEKFKAAQPFTGAFIRTADPPAPGSTVKNPNQLATERERLEATERASQFMARHHAKLQRRTREERVELAERYAMTGKTGDVEFDGRN